MPNDFLAEDSLEPLRAPRWFCRPADWVKTHTRLVLGAGVLFQLLVLASMIALHSAPLVFGQRIWLRVRPVDPRDIFRGDYVILSYDFSRMPVNGAPTRPTWQPAGSAESWLEDRNIYVSLVPDADGIHYVASEVSFERPRSGRYIKGKYGSSVDGNMLHFGIEAFYVEEGHGKALENLRNANQLSAEIALTSWGQATLCALK
jgi:uncharacterized membrane-anchored protein